MIAALQAGSPSFGAAMPVAAVELQPANLAKIHAPLLAQKGRVEVSIVLQPLVELAGRDAKKVGAKLGRSQQQAQLADVKAQQDRVAAEIAKAGGKELARVSKAINALVVSIDAAALPAIARLPEVRSVKPMVDYHQHLSETVPFIGAAALQAAGVDGTGVKVAVLDSGIDYTHKNLGGPGTVAAYAAAYGAGVDDPRNYRDRPVPDRQGG